MEKGRAPRCPTLPTLGPPPRNSVGSSSVAAEVLASRKELTWAAEPSTLEQLNISDTMYYKANSRIPRASQDSAGASGLLETS